MNAEHRWLEAYPELAADAFRAFAEAKAVYMDRLKSGTITSPTKADETNKQVLDMIGDPLPYGMAANRASLDALAQIAFDEKLTPHRIAVPDAFLDPEA